MPSANAIFEAVKLALKEVFSLLSDGTLLTNPRFFEKILNGNGFAVGHRFEGLADGEVAEIYFENPQDSNKKVYIIAILVSSTGKAFIDIYRNNSIATSGTKLEPVNLNFGSNNNSVVYAEYGGSYNLGDKVFDDLNPGGAKTKAIGWVSEVGESVIIPSGFNFVVAVTNKAGASADIAIRILWWEEETI